MVPSREEFMEQHKALKAEANEALLLYRFGDFLEGYFGDAETMGEVNDFIVTQTHIGTRNSKKVPVCMIPVHAAHIYIKRLEDEGHNCRICIRKDDNALSYKLAGLDADGQIIIVPIKGGG